MLFAACARAGPPPSRPGTLVIAVLQEPASLNPLYLQGGIGHAISELSYTYLTNYDSNGNVVPEVAVTVPSLTNGGISPDGKRIVYHLRRDVSWQDGAHAELARRYLHVSRDHGPIERRSVSLWLRPRRFRRGAQSVHGDLEAQKAVFANRRYFFGGDSNYPILPAHLLAQYASLDRVAYNAAPIGSGPYRFMRWVRGDRLEMSANPRYYAGRPAIGRISLRFIHDPSTTINQLLTNEVDATFSADVSQIAALRCIPHHRIVITPIPSFCALSFNVD